ncbi:hypothetical protein OH76DRAFT_693877 [Lentinus brumalis]|uniref:SUN domain-containing protein n=1 Tax=Lentinus brumalis TaxID=2498619 RepID=A0A371D656_9APHY|nr:hypothetical protein OH76DRAFT_693877 [Polyporus brumalis]
MARTTSLLLIITSTPTAKPVPLPPPEPSTTPMSEPPARASSGHTEDAQPQPSPGTPPVSPPLTPPGANTQPMFNLQTPPRRPQFHTPKQEFETPPPPRGMPDLPGPPSSEDEHNDEHEGDHTPLMQSHELQGDLTSLKTPRPPGAWLATPAPSRQVTKEPVQRPGSAPPLGSSASSDSGLATPPATFSRATPLPAQTPAPPGGWVATPAAGNTTRRGSILKVRFDLQAETASEAATEGDDSLESRYQGEPQEASSSAEAAPFNGDASSASSAPEESSAEPPPTPPSIRDRPRKKSPGVRILDAFGREQVENAPQPATQDSPAELVVSERKPPTPSTPRTATRAVSNVTPRNHSGVRVVDAMGREIEEEPAVKEESVLSQSPLTHNEALSRIKDTLSCMKHELSDADRSSDDAMFDARMYAALQEQCKAAEDARNKISQSLQMAQSAESEVKSKYSTFRNRVAKSAALLPLGGADGRLTWKPLSWRFLVAFVLVQMLLLALMYRYSLVQARKVFLTTYYDSFYPELYIYLLNPDTTQHTIPSCPSWSFFTILNSMKRAGFLGVVSDAWQSASCVVSSHLQATWVGWHYAQDTVTASWPPT